MWSILVWYLTLKNSWEQRKGFHLPSSFSTSNDKLSQIITHTRCMPRRVQNPSLQHTVPSAHNPDKSCFGNHLIVSRHYNRNRTDLDHTRDSAQVLVWSPSPKIQSYSECLLLNSAPRMPHLAVEGVAAHIRFFPPALYTASGFIFSFPCDKTTNIADSLSKMWGTDTHYTVCDYVALYLCVRH